METPKLGQLIEGEAQRDAIHIAIVPIVAVGELQPSQHIGVRKIAGQYVSFNLNTVGVVDPFLKEPVKNGQQFWLFLYPQTITALRHDWTHPAFEYPSLPDGPQAYDRRLEQTHPSYWRTDNVIKLCREMRQSKEYRKLMPILADALQDVDFTDLKVINLLQSEYVNIAEAERVVAKLYSDETAHAVEWLEEYADAIGVSYRILMEAAEAKIQYDDHYVLGYDTPECVYNKSDEFWEKYEIVTGQTVEADKKTSFFSCSC